MASDGGALLGSYNRVFFKKTKRGKVARIVREQYLRDEANRFQDRVKYLVETGASHFILPDQEVAQNFVELFEFENYLVNVIWLDTVLDEVSFPLTPIADNCAHRFKIQLTREHLRE